MTTPKAKFAGLALIAALVVCLLVAVPATTQAETPKPRTLWDAASLMVGEAAYEKGDYVKAARQCANGEVLFPDLKPDARGYFSDGFQKWFGRHLIQIGAKKPKTSFHSFRHNFRDALRESDVKRDSVLALGGWAGGIEETYGGGLKATTLAREIAKIRYPGLDLGRLHLK